MLNTRSKSFLALCFFITGPLQAAVTETQAAKLGKELTPMGAEKAANTAGTIPAWDGGITTPPADYRKGSNFPNPFKDDKVLYEVTVQNLSEHKDKLTPGQLALFEKDPEFKMRVFPTRRSAAYPEHVYAATRENATRAALADNGVDVKNAIIGIPFPIPQNGLEAIWNHLLRYRGESARRSVIEASVFPNGRVNYIRFIDEYIFAYSKKDARADKLNNVLGYFKQTFTSPARFAGTLLLIHETLDQVREPRPTWLYNPGQRRVRRAPFVGYDYPAPTSDNLRFVDQFDMYNGAPDRYDWELLGKREILIPYNSYSIYEKGLKPSTLLTPKHPNTDYLRYELHRVWVVEAKLKKGKRHLHPRRTFYLDEDSWQAVLADEYDSSGKLWRLAERHSVNYYQVPAVWTAMEIHYDLTNNRYLMMGLSAEGTPYEFNVPMDSSDFTPSQLRRTGLR